MQLFMVHLSRDPQLGSGHSQRDVVPSHPPNVLTRVNCIHQRRISIKQWHQVLWDLQSMELSLPGAIGMLIHMQESLLHVNGKSVTMMQGLHASMTEFW